MLKCSQNFHSIIEIIKISVNNFEGKLSKNNLKFIKCFLNNVLALYRVINCIRKI